MGADSVIMGKKRANVIGNLVGNSIIRAISAATIRSEGGGIFSPIRSELHRIHLYVRGPV